MCQILISGKILTLKIDTTFNKLELTGNLKRTQFARVFDVKSGLKLF